MGARIGGLILALVLVTTWFQVSTFGQSLCDFQLPESTITVANLGFSYRHVYDGSAGEVEASSGWLAGRVEKLYDSPDFGYTMWVRTRLEMERWLATAWATNGWMSYRYYFADELPLFAYAGVLVDAATSFVQPGCEIRSGLGVGRFRDVTPLAKANRIVDVLLKEGNLGRAIASPDMLRIAEEIARSDSYASSEEHVAAVAELIGSAIGMSLDSSVILAIETELENEAIERYCGAILQGGVGYELVDPHRDVEDLFYVLSGDAARALTPDSQLRCRLSWSSAGEHALARSSCVLDIVYDALLTSRNAVRAAYTIQRATTGSSQAVASQRATVEYTLRAGPGDLVLGFTASHEAGDPRWSLDFSISLAVDLL